MRPTLLAFVTLFVAVDILGMLPVYISLTANLEGATRRRLPFQSVLTATAVAVGFLILGQSVFELMGITAGDFQIAGGVLLFLLSTYDIIAPGMSRRYPARHLGVVPLGTPLIVGPAVLATLIVLVQSYGYAATLAALGANMLVAFLVLHQAPRLAGVLGEMGSEAIAKVAALFLAAFGVSLIRRGLEGFRLG
jgi:multiple antibiotic resistance protein